MGGEQSFTVTIRVVKRTKDDLIYANMIYEPALLHVHRSDRITWQCEGSGLPSVAIQFNGISPVTTPLHQDNGKVWGTVTGVLAGVYEYACAVSLDGQVYLDACCPAVIVDDQ